MGVEIFRGSHLGLKLKAQPHQGLTVEIPPSAVDQLYYRIANDSVEVSDDLRRFAGVSSKLDERAIYSLLQFGAVIPPLSVWKDVKRAVPGKATVFQSAPAAVKEEPIGTVTFGKMASTFPSTEEQISLVLSVIDASLMAASKERCLIILFSGGIDSGLLAARAAALGLKETLLVNFSFGPDDAESILAEKMAGHLGLSFVRLEDTASGTDVSDVLSKAAEYYRTPFCDHSSIPTCALVKAVIGRFGSGYVAFDGTGADGAFGLFNKARQWQRLCALPRTLRRFGSVGYRAFESWQRESTVEHRLRVLRRAEQLRYPFAAVAQNPLHGIAYHVRKEIRDEVETMASSWLRSLCPPDPHIQLASIDLAFVCACIFAQKSKSLFTASDLDVVYPFLSPEMFAMAVSAGDWAGSDGQAKWVLKSALERFVPREMVYRPKSGFVAPMKQKLSQDAFLSRFEKLKSGNSCISPVLDRDFFKKLEPLVKRGDTLPAQTTNFVWGAVFVSEWLEQVVTRVAPPASRLSKATA